MQSSSWRSAERCTRIEEVRARIPVQAYVLTTAYVAEKQQQKLWGTNAFIHLTVLFRKLDNLSYSRNTCFASWLSFTGYVQLVRPATEYTTVG